MKKSNNKNKNFSIFEVENILKKQKMLFALWNASSKKDSHHQHYYLPLKKLFWKAILFDPRKVRFKYGSKKMNEIFMDLVIKEKPDYVMLIVGREELTIETMMKIKKFSSKTKIIAFVGDDDIDFEPLKRYQALFVDCNFIAQSNYAQKYYKDGIKNIYPTDHGVNTEIFKPMNTKKIYDVTFVGQPSPPRIDLLRFLINNNIKLNVFSRGWNDYPEFKEFYKGVPDSEEFVKIINQTKINLAFSKNRYGKPHFKGRVFESAACRSFSISDYFSGYLKFFKNNEEIMMFKNNEDLLKKIRYYLKHEKEREKIAENAYKKAIKNHRLSIEYKKLFKKILENEKTFSRKLPNLNKKILIISEEDIEKGFKKIKEKIKDADYIHFSEGKSKFLKYKEYLHLYSFEKTKKDISCCDYYVYDKALGNYLLLNLHKAFNSIKRKNFNKLLTLNQIAVSKKFFLNNFEKFKEFFYGKDIDLIDKENTCFISIPLVKIKKLNKMNYETFSETFQKTFVIHLYSLLNQKKLFFNKYLYQLLFFSFTKNIFILRYLLNLVINKENWNKVKM